MLLDATHVSSTTSCVCDCECCDIDRNKPFQVVTHKNIESSKGKQQRMFQKKWNDQELRRKMLLIQLHSLPFLMRQGLAVRGHNYEGNLSQLMI